MGGKMSAVVDRNLLFGMLALQLDFISQDQLTEAMSDWTRQKHRPLGDLLVERGALTAADLAVLAPLVGRHIAKHGGEPTRSLATLTTTGLARQALGSTGDRDVLASLTHLPEAKVARVMSTAPASTGRFVIERPHARGGLGEVFVARDQELNRAVALKRMQDRHADDPVSQSLFLAEGEITGGLEHPGIIPVYGLGKSENGRPYYAMRFVQGETLQGAIERFHGGTSDPSARNLAFRELLGRFLDMCNAVAYAHQRGVLHRDLKPNNVLLGAFGETLVIDWGMAKVLSSASRERQRPEHADVTLPGHTTEPLHLNSHPLATVGRGAHGTPGYMSPEQAGGRIDELGPATDIYSLGATLYHLLTGRPSWTKQDGDPIAYAQRGVFPAPRQLKPDVPQALDAICCKAMAFAPANRYASVRDLSDDVKHWLADEPVSVWREPWTLRARRWMRKHPGRVASAAATVLVSLVAVVIASLLLGAKNRALSAALVRETKERERADERTRVARERMEIGLEAFRTHVFAANRWLENRPLTQELRRLLLEGAVQGLTELARDGEELDDADRTRMAAHLALGDIALQLKGDLATARAKYQLALDMAKELVEQAPYDRRAQRDVTVAHERMGDVLLRLGNTEEALQEQQKALELRETMIEEQPDDEEVQRDLSVSHERLGIIHQEMKRNDLARGEYQESLRISKQLARARPKDPRARHDLAIAHDRLGRFHLQQQELAEAEKEFTAELRLCQELAEQFRDDLVYQRDLSIAHERLGDVHYGRKEYEQATPHFEDCFRIRQRLLQGDPNNRENKRNYTLALNRVGDLAVHRNDVPEALRKYLESVRIGQALAAEAPEDVSAQQDLAQTLTNLESMARMVSESSYTGERLFECSRGFARCLALLPPARQEPLATQTLTLLRKARANGALANQNNVDALRNSPDFAALRSREEFKQLLP